MAVFGCNKPYGAGSQNKSFVVQAAHEHVNAFSNFTQYVLSCIIIENVRPYKSPEWSKSNADAHQVSRNFGRPTNNDQCIE
jgi:hypothetical protein